MVVILFRHGHKQFSTDDDPPLSPRGFEQSKNLENLILQKALPFPTHCWFSEKIRTRQTLQECLKNPQVIPFEKMDLNHRTSEEAYPHFKQRIQRFLQEISRRSPKNEVHFVCTHYDWIEEALLLMKSDRDLNTYELSSWAPGQYVEFEVIDGLFQSIKKGVL